MLLSFDWSVIIDLTLENLLIEPIQRLLEIVASWDDLSKAVFLVEKFSFTIFNPSKCLE